MDVRSKEEEPDGIHILHETPGALREWCLRLCGTLAGQNALRFCAPLGPQKDDDLENVYSCTSEKQLWSNVQSGSRRECSIVRRFHIPISSLELSVR